MNNTYNPETYWDDVAITIANRDEKKVIAGDNEPYYSYKRKQFLKLLDTIDFSNKIVLEIGSGPGGNLNYLSEKNCKKLFGVDVSNKMISLANELLIGKDIEIKKINGTELPFSDKMFDIVFTSTVLQHNTNEENLTALIEEICRVSGKEVILFERIEKRVKGHESNHGRPVEFYSNILEKNGFKLSQKRFLPIQASFYLSGFFRVYLNKKNRKEGEPLSKISIIAQKISLPITSIFDRIIPSKRDLGMLRFIRE
jgi:ubiquinone/menaquinone biosynthesis C-methylase UbiE